MVMKSNSECKKHKYWAREQSYDETSLHGGSKDRENFEDRDDQGFRPTEDVCLVNEPRL